MLRAHVGCAMRVERGREGDELYVRVNIGRWEKGVRTGIT